MAGISSKAAGKLSNRLKFNGGNEFQNGEFIDGSGLETYDAVHRMYDPQIGRFHQIDALSDVSNNYSTYSFASDNPIHRNDPLGLADTTTINDGNVATVKGIRHKPRSGFYWPNSTKSERQEWDRSEDVYNRRASNRQALGQKGDPSSYTSHLPMYQNWSKEEKNYRAMQSFVVGILGTPVLVSISPAVVVAAIRMKVQANIIAAGADFGVQALMNGSEHKSISSNWNPVSTVLSFGLGAPTHSISNIAGVSLFSSSISSSINLSPTAIGKNNIFSFDPRSIIINAVFGTAAGVGSNQFKVDFRNSSLGDGFSQTISLAGAAVDNNTKEQQ